MGLQKYRADKQGQTQSDNAVPWYSNWIGGPSLALIRNCPTPYGPRTVYIRGEPDTFFSIPAACEVRLNGKRITIKGYITTTNHGEYVFRVYQRDNVLVLGA